MTPVVSVAARSAVIVIAVYLLFVAASIVLLDAPVEHRLRALQRSFTEIPPLTVVVIGWLSFLGWTWLEQRKSHEAARSRLGGAGWAIVTTLLMSAGFVALYEIVLRLFSGFPFYGRAWRYELRIFEAALFAVALVRISLPLFPSFARMPPHNP